MRVLEGINICVQVMVHHARELPLPSGGQEPSTYVKVYLLPDPQKQTKRKTKVVRRSCHPSFMEMVSFGILLEMIWIYRNQPCMQQYYNTFSIYSFMF